MLVESPFIGSIATMTPFSKGDFGGLPNSSVMPGDTSLLPTQKQFNPLDVGSVCLQTLMPTSDGMNTSQTDSPDFMRLTSTEQTPFPTENIVFTPDFHELGQEVQSTTKVFEDLGRTFAIPLLHEVTTTTADGLDLLIKELEGQTGNNDALEEKPSPPLNFWQKMTGNFAAILPAVANLHQSAQNPANTAGSLFKINVWPEGVAAVLGIEAATLAEIMSVGGSEAMNHYLLDTQGRMSLARELIVRSTALYSLLYTNALSHSVALTAPERGVMWASIGTLCSNQLFDKIAEGLFFATKAVPDEVHVKWISQTIWTIARHASWYIALANLAFHHDMFLTNSSYDAGVSVIFFGLITNEIWKLYTSLQAKRQNLHRPF